MLPYPVAAPRTRREDADTRARQSQSSRATRAKKMRCLSGNAPYWNGKPSHSVFAITKTPRPPNLSSPRPPRPAHLSTLHGDYHCRRKLQDHCRRKRQEGFVAGASRSPCRRRSSLEIADPRTRVDGMRAQRGRSCRAALVVLVVSCLYLPVVAFTTPACGCRRVAALAETGWR